jgi:branched-chain amino acid transport system permease protein
MAVTSETIHTRRDSIKEFLLKIWEPYRKVPLLGWILSSMVAVALELFVGLTLARILGLSKVPALFGVGIALKDPHLIPVALLYVILIYILPIGIFARLTTKFTNRLAGRMLSLPFWLAEIIHLILIYAILHFWSGLNDYRLLVARLILVAIIFTLSLNVINGYMGEFSCSHPGFIALGAYMASVFTVLLFVDDPLFGAALLPAALGRFLFPIGLILGGIIAALGAILIAVPSFRTRGDYLAIISLAFMFIIKSLLENLEVVGGARGLGGQPDWASLPVVYFWTVLCVWIINNFVTSTMGKALNSVRDGELAASAMTVNTRRTKMIAFLFGAFWAGVGGGLFAHVIRYVNPGTFGLTMLAEVLAMVYFGGLNSVVGSIFGAVGINLLSEALRPLEIYKWIIIPVLLIFIMIYQPRGVLAFREFNFKKMIQPKTDDAEEVKDAAAAD